MSASTTTVVPNHQNNNTAWDISVLLYVYSLMYFTMSKLDWRVLVLVVLHLMIWI